MADEPGRTPEDINLARGIAAGVADRRRDVLERRIAPFDLFEDLTRRVQSAVTGGAAFLAPERAEQLSQSLHDTTRLYRFFARNDMPFVLALPGMQNVFHAPVVVDVFSARALQGLGVASEPPPADKPEIWPQWQPLVKHLIEYKKAEPVDREKAYEGTISLFVDTLRAIASDSTGRGSPVAALAGGGGGGAGGAPPPPRATTMASTTTAFTVHSANSGYQLDYFPQYRYTPTVFGGAALSTPVSQTIATGHYCFEGRKGGTTTRDAGVHYAGPGSTSTRTTAF
jgi:hypothetical protein